jgi:hypothetical protein
VIKLFGFIIHSIYDCSLLFNRQVAINCFLACKDVIARTKLLTTDVCYGCGSIHFLGIRKPRTTKFAHEPTDEDLVTKRTLSPHYTLTPTLSSSFPLRTLSITVRIFRNPNFSYPLLYVRYSERHIFDSMLK